MRNFVLTRRAEKSLVDIVSWTIEKFGKRQALHYRDELIDRCRAVCNGTALTTDCSRLLGEALSVRLQMTRAGEHHVIFLENGEQIVILDFVHNRMNLHDRISKLIPPTS